MDGSCKIKGKSAHPQFVHADACYCSVAVVVAVVLVVMVRPLLTMAGFASY